MMELLKSAWKGWLSYTEHGKMAALLIVVLLFLWFKREAVKEKVLLGYTTIMALCCVFPITAACLMLYQTRFYSYEWIWNYVPITLVIAGGITFFLLSQWEGLKKEREAVRRFGAVVAALLGILILCGGLGDKGFEERALRKELGNAGQLMDALQQEAQGQELCLWAPKEVMAYARALDGNIKLLYGRNIWDAALGAYSYDTYTEKEESLYLWMSHLEETAELDYQTEEKLISGVQCMQVAVAAGANCILLPIDISSEVLGRLEASIGIKAVPIGEYYLLMIRAEA